MKNAYRAGNAMRAAIEMDGRHPPGAKTMQYGNNNITNYRNTPEFMRELEERGVRGRAAEAHLKGISVQTEFGTGETIIINAETGYRINKNREKRAKLVNITHYEGWL